MIALKDGRLCVSGPMTLASAAALLAAGLTQLPQAPAGVDLAGVEAVDSSALAVLLEWARAAGRPLAVTAAPPALSALAALYDLDGLLGLAPAA